MLFHVKQLNSDMSGIGENPGDDGLVVRMTNDVLRITWYDHGSVGDIRCSRIGDGPLEFLNALWQCPSAFPVHRASSWPPWSPGSQVRTRSPGRCEEIVRGHHRHKASDSCYVIRATYHVPRLHSARRPRASPAERRGPTNGTQQQSAIPPHQATLSPLGPLLLVRKNDCSARLVTL